MWRALGSSVLGLLADVCAVNTYEVCLARGGFCSFNFMPVDSLAWRICSSDLWP